MTVDFASTEGLDLALPARKTTPSEMVAYAEAAEASSWGGVWLAEVLSLDAAVLVGAFAQRLRRIRVGTSIVPITTRSPALLGMFAATAVSLLPGRFGMGLGLSTPAIVATRHNRPVRRPVELARATIEVLDKVLLGGEVERNDELGVASLRIGPVTERPPLFLAALGPKMLETAARVADGQMLNLVTHDDAVAKAGHARDASGSTTFATYLSTRVCVDPTPEDVSAIRREIASYCSVPVYVANFKRQKFDMTQVVPGRDGHAAELPEDLLDAMVVMGSASHCRERLDQLRADGIRPIVVPVGTPDSTHRVIERLSPGA